MWQHSFALHLRLMSGSRDPKMRQSTSLLANC